MGANGQHAGIDVSDRIEVLKAIIEAWCERHDIDAVLAHLTEDVQWHYSAVAAPPVVGHAGARAFLEQHKKRARRPRWQVFACAESDNALFIEGADSFELPSGQRVVIPYMGILEFDGARICGWRDYLDAGTAAACMSGQPLPEHARALIERPALPGLGG